MGQGLESIFDVGSTARRPNMPQLLHGGVMYTQRFRYVHPVLGKLISIEFLLLTLEPLGFWATSCLKGVVYD